jgi:hypothetical protein
MSVPRKVAQRVSKLTCEKVLNKATRSFNARERTIARESYFLGWNEAIDAVLLHVHRIHEDPSIATPYGRDQALRKAIAKAPFRGPHDRDDCPCDHHAPGTQAPCGACNCADGVP